LLRAALGEAGDAEEFSGEAAELIGEDAEDGEYFRDGAERLFRGSCGGVGGLPCFVSDAHELLLRVAGCRPDGMVVLAVFAVPVAD
jgi:hypothetical protein